MIIFLHRDLEKKSYNLNNNASKINLNYLQIWNVYFLFVRIVVY